MASSRAAPTSLLGSPLAIPSSNRNRKVGADDFLYGVLLGEGSYGKVVHGRMKRGILSSLSASYSNGTTTTPPVVPSPSVVLSSTSLSVATGSTNTNVPLPSPLSSSFNLPTPTATPLLTSSTSSSSSSLSSAASSLSTTAYVPPGLPVSPSLLSFQLPSTSSSSSSSSFSNTPLPTPNPAVSSSSTATTTEYAIKIMDKRFIKREGKTHLVMMERNVMSKAVHPNIVKLIYTFQDNYNLYMVSDLCKGGELRHVILYYRDQHRKEFEEEKNRNTTTSTNTNNGHPYPSADRPNEDSILPVPSSTNGGSFSSTSSYSTTKLATVPAMPLHVTRFYIAQIVCALEYLHLTLGVVHRDLKPENILLTEKGFAKVTDFGSSKDETIVYDDNRQDTFVGTAEYVSPEILKDEIAHAPVDLWALGCILYQCLTGRPPFRGASEYLTFQQILGYDYSKTVEMGMRTSTDTDNEYEGCGVYVLEGSSNSTSEDDVSDFYTSPSIDANGEPLIVPSTTIDESNDYDKTSFVDPSRNERTASISAALASQPPKVLLRFPVWMTHDARDLILQFLHPSPLQRLGVIGTKDTVDESTTTYKACGPILMDYSRIRNHPFFNGIDWKLLIDTKNCVPPYTPPVRYFPDPVNANIPTSLADIDAMPDLSVLPPTAIPIPIVESVSSYSSSSVSVGTLLPPLPPIRTISSSSSTTNQSNRFSTNLAFDGTPIQTVSPSFTPTTTVSTAQNHGNGITITRIYRTNSDVGDNTSVNNHHQSHPSLNGNGYFTDSTVPRVSTNPYISSSSSASSRSVSPLAVSALPLRSSLSSSSSSHSFSALSVPLSNNDTNVSQPPHTTVHTIAIPSTPGRTSPVVNVLHPLNGPPLVHSIPPVTPSSSSSSTRTFGSMFMSFFGGNATPSHGNTSNSNANGTTGGVGTTSSRQSSRRNSLTINTNTTTIGSSVSSILHATDHTNSINTGVSPILESWKTRDYTNNQNNLLSPNGTSTASVASEDHPVAISMVSQPRSSNSPLPTSRLLLEEEDAHETVNGTVGNLALDSSSSSPSFSSSLTLSLRGTGATDSYVPTNGNNPSTVSLHNVSKETPDTEHITTTAIDPPPHQRQHTSNGKDLPEVRNLRAFLREDHIPIPIHDASTVTTTAANTTNATATTTAGTYASSAVDPLLTKTVPVQSPVPLLTSPLPTANATNNTSGNYPLVTPKVSVPVSTMQDTSTMYWAKFIDSSNGEYAVRWGPVIRRKTYGGLFSRDKQRDLVLTFGGPEGPRLLYCHTPTLSLRSSISLNDPELRVMVRSGDANLDDNGITTTNSRIPLNDIPPTPSSFSRFTQWLGFGNAPTTTNPSSTLKRLDTSRIINRPITEPDGTDDGELTNSIVRKPSLLTDTVTGDTTPIMSRRLSRARTKSFILGQALSGSPIITTGLLSSPSALNDSFTGNSKEFMLNIRGDEETNLRSRSFDGTTAGTPSSYHSPRLSVADMAFVAVTNQQRSPRLSRVTDRMFTTLRTVGSSSSIKEGSSSSSNSCGTVTTGSTTVRMTPLIFDSKDTVDELMKNNSHRKDSNGETTIPWQPSDDGKDCEVLSSSSSSSSSSSVTTQSLPNDTANNSTNGISTNMHTEDDDEAKLENIITVTEYAAQTGRRHSAPELITNLPGMDAMNTIVTTTPATTVQLPVQDSSSTVPPPPEENRTESARRGNDGTYTDNNTNPTTANTGVPGTPVTNKPFVPPLSLSLSSSSSSSLSSSSAALVTSSRERGIFDIHTGTKSSSNGRIFYLYDPLGAAVVWRDAILAAKNEALRIQHLHSSNQSTLSASTGLSVKSMVIGGTGNVTNTTA